MKVPMLILAPPLENRIRPLVPVLRQGGHCRHMPVQAEHSLITKHSLVRLPALRGLIGVFRRNRPPCGDPCILEDTLRIQIECLSFRFQLARSFTVTGVPVTDITADRPLSRQVLPDRKPDPGAAGIRISPLPAFLIADIRTDQTRQLVAREIHQVMQLRPS